MFALDPLGTVPNPTLSEGTLSVYPNEEFNERLFRQSYFAVYRGQVKFSPTQRAFMDKRDTSDDTAFLVDAQLFVPLANDPNLASDALEHLDEPVANLYHFHAHNAEKMVAGTLLFNKVYIYTDNVAVHEALGTQDAVEWVKYEEDPYIFFLQDGYVIANHNLADPNAYNTAFSVEILAGHFVKVFKEHFLRGRVIANTRFFLDEEEINGLEYIGTLSSAGGTSYVRDHLHVAYLSMANYPYRTIQAFYDSDKGNLDPDAPKIPRTLLAPLAHGTVTYNPATNTFEFDGITPEEYANINVSAGYNKAYVNDNFIETHVPHDTDRNQVNISAVLALGASKIYYLDEQQVEDYIRNSAPLIDAKFSKKINFNKVFKKNDTVEQWVSTWNALVVTTLAGGTDALKDTNLESLDEVRDFLERLKTNNTNYTNPNNSDDFSGDDWDYIGEVDTRGTHELGSINGNLLFNHVVKSVLFWLYRKTGESKRFYPYWFDGLDVEFNDNVGEYRKKITFRCTQYESEVSNISTDEFKALRLVRGERADDPYQNTSEVVETAIKGNAIYFSFTEDDTIRPVEHTTYFTPYNDASYREFTFISYDSEEYVLSNTYTLPRVKERDVYKLIHIYSSTKFKHSIFPEVFTLSVVAEGVAQHTSLDYAIRDDSVLHTSVKREGALSHLLMHSNSLLAVATYRDILGEVRAYTDPYENYYWVDKLGYLHATKEGAGRYFDDWHSYELNITNSQRLYSNFYGRSLTNHINSIPAYLDVYVLGEATSLYVDKVVLHLPEVTDTNNTVINGVFSIRSTPTDRNGKVATHPTYIPADAQVVCDGVTLTISNLQGRIPIDYIATVVPTIDVAGLTYRYITDPYLPNIRYIYPESTYIAREKFYPIPVSDKEVKLLTPVEASGWILTFYKKPTDSTPVDIDKAVLELYKEYANKTDYSNIEEFVQSKVGSAYDTDPVQLYNPQENVSLTSAIHNSYMFKALKELGVTRVFPFIFDYIEFTYEGEYHDLVLKGLFRNTYHEGTDLTLEDLEYELYAINIRRDFLVMNVGEDNSARTVQVTPVTAVTNGVIEVRFELPLAKHSEYLSAVNVYKWQRIQPTVHLGFLYIREKGEGLFDRQVSYGKGSNLLNSGRSPYVISRGWADYLHSTPDLNPFELFSKWYKQGSVLPSNTSPMLVYGRGSYVHLPNTSDYVVKVDGRIYAIHSSRYGITQAGTAIGLEKVHSAPYGADLHKEALYVKHLFINNAFTLFTSLDLYKLTQGAEVTLEYYDPSTQTYKTLHSDAEYPNWVWETSSHTYSKVYLQDRSSESNTNPVVDVHHTEITYTYTGVTSGKHVKLKAITPYTDVPEGSYLYSDHISNGKWTKWVENETGTEVTATFVTNPELGIQNNIHHNYPDMVWEVTDISTGKVTYAYVGRLNSSSSYYEETFYTISVEKERYIQEQLLPAMRNYTETKQVGDWTLSPVLPQLIRDLGWQVGVEQLRLPSSSGSVNAQIDNEDLGNYSTGSPIPITDTFLAYINDIESGTATVAESLDELDVTKYSLANHPEVPLVAVRYENALYLAVPADRYYQLLYYSSPRKPHDADYLTLSEVLEHMQRANGYFTKFTVVNEVEDVPSAEDDNPTIQPPQGDDTMDTQPNDQNNAQCVCVCETTLKAQREQQEKERKMAETKQKGNDLLSLVRVNVTCLDPMKRNYEGEVITVSNDVIGSIKKYVAYGTTNGWHLPKIIVNELKQKKVQIFSKQKNSKGDDTITPKLINAYSVEELPPLSPEELKELAKVQLAQGL